MTNSIFTCSPSIGYNTDDDPFTSTWSPTEDERRRIKEFHDDARREAATEQLFRFGTGIEPSVVLDEFLFLGNIHHGSDLELLERFKIGKAR
jgi:hypothetical protein